MRQAQVLPLILLSAIVMTAATACSKADAAAKSSPSDQAAGAPAPALSSLPGAAAASDSLSDSVLIARADQGRLMGRDSGTIWVVMISDFQCPYCKQWHDQSMQKLTNDYVRNGKVRMAYLNFPLQQHRFAMVEAVAALCAGVQGRFWPFAEQLFAHQEAIGNLSSIEPLLDSIARGQSLVMADFGRCRQRPAIRDLVASDVQQANKTGVRSTPSFLVGDFLVQGAAPYADFRKAVDTALVLARKARGAR